MVEDHKTLPRLHPNRVRPIAFQLLIPCSPSLQSWDPPAEKCAPCNPWRTNPFLSIYPNSAQGRGANRPTRPSFPSPQGDISYLRQHQEGGAENCSPTSPRAEPTHTPSASTSSTSSLWAVDMESPGVRHVLPVTAAAAAPPLRPTLLQVAPSLFSHHQATLPTTDAELNLSRGAQTARREEPAKPSFTPERRGAPGARGAEAEVP